MNAIIQFFTDIYNKTIDLFSSCISWLVSLFTSTFDSFLDLLIEAVPDLSSYWDRLSVISSYTSFINKFFPLQEAGIFIGLYFVFIGVFLTVKYIVKCFIPFVG